MVSPTAIAVPLLVLCAPHVLWIIGGVVCAFLALAAAGALLAALP